MISVSWPLARVHWSYARPHQTLRRVARFCDISKADPGWGRLSKSRVGCGGRTLLRSASFGGRALSVIEFGCGGTQPPEIAVRNGGLKQAAVYERTRFGTQRHFDLRSIL
jgi:hypothetical protein